MPVNDSSTSLGLLQQAKAADTQAWERLRAVYAPLVTYWCRRSGLSHHDAEDVSQEVFAAVSKGLDGYERNAKFRTWLRTITINKIRDFARQANSRPHPVGGTTAADEFQRIAFPERSPDDEQHEDDLLLGKLLEITRDSIAPHTWQAFWLTTVDASPVSIVAEKLGLSEGAVRQAKHRVLRRLRKEIEFLESDKEQ